MRVGVIGINHKLADLKLRDQLAKACQRRFGPSQSLLIYQCVLLSTCNRTEIYFSSEDLAETHTSLLSILRNDVDEEFDQKLYSYFGVDCFCHLSRVTSGLDSAIVAETEIQGQVKAAYEATCEYHLLPKELHFLFQKSLGIAKKIRTELDLGRGMPSLEHAVLQTGLEFFGQQDQPRILFVGASDINQKVLSFLKSKRFSHITLCNRSNDIAKIIADNDHIQFLEWQKLSQWHYYDWIIFGTKSPDYLLTRKDCSDTWSDKKLIMDLCVPRNVDPQLQLDPRITLMNIDEVNKHLQISCEGLHQTLNEAEQRISLATRQHAMRYQEKEISRLTILATA